MNDPRYLEARAAMAGRIRQFDRSIINDPDISDDEYNRRSSEFSYAQTRQLFRDNMYLWNEARSTVAAAERKTQ